MNYSIKNLNEEQGGYANKYRQSEVIKGNTYRDLSTIVIIPTRGLIHCQVVGSWWSLINPMNQKFTRVFASGMEVADAYNNMIEQLLANPELSKWKFILTLEEDNLPPPDGLLRLYENIDRYDVIGGLYWTKGEGGQPMIYGDIKDPELNFRPQPPVIDIQPCNGLGMGFTLFRLSIFKDSRIEKPWFKTVNEFSTESGPRLYTQDLYFFEKIRKLDYKVACDTRVKVGHIDPQTETIW